MGAWKMRSLCRKKPMPIKFLLSGGWGYFGFGGGGGGKCQFYFCGREDFSDFVPSRFYSSAKRYLLLTDVFGNRFLDRIPDHLTELAK